MTIVPCDCRPSRPDILRTIGAIIVYGGMLIGLGWSMARAWYEHE